jgi:hypothetical protein
LAAITIPVDTWTSSSDKVKPQKGPQYSLGYFRNFSDNKYEASVECYYKEMHNQIEYKEGALPQDDPNNNSDNQFTFGEGWAYGTELFAKKRIGKFTGWVGYTLSYTLRKFKEINQGKPFYAKYDRRHDASIALNYDYNKRWSFATVWVYGTGTAVTMPVSYYFMDGNQVLEYTDRNAYRMDAYHRMDVSATYTVNREKRLEKRKQRLVNRNEGKEMTSLEIPKNAFKHFESSWTFSVFNVYNRHNPYLIYFQNTGSVANGDFQIKAKKMYLFPILPSVTWNFKF